MGFGDEREHRQRVDVFVHFDAETQKLVRLLIKHFENEPTPRPAATHAVLVVTPTKGQQMAGQITVDTTNETVAIQFVDDKGDTNAAPPVAASGAALVVTFTSDNEAVATVATDAANALQGDITPVAEGTANIGATLAYADGTEVFEADGTTLFPDPAPAAITVTAGAAVGDALILSA